MKTRKYSRKREAIISKLRSTKTHPTAQWIFDELKNDHPDIGIATVYRNLGEFRESGEIVSLGPINGVERFDAETTRHDHFICESCGAIIDVPNQPGCDRTYPNLPTELAFEVTKHHTTYYGRCIDCK